MLPALPRVGFVLAVTATLATVAFEDGSSADSLSWVSSGYTPAVGDRVLVLPSDTGWVVASKVTPRPQLVPAQQVTFPVTPLAEYGRLEAQGNVSVQWAAMTDGSVQAGNYAEMTDELGLVRLRYGAFQKVDLAGRIPSGATVTQVTISVRHDGTDDPRTDVQTSFAAARPVLWLHNLATVPAGGTAPSFVAGPLPGPNVQIGEEVTMTLPSTWVTALLSGTATGVAFYSEDIDDGFFLSWEGVDVTATYTGGTL